MHQVLVLNASYEPLNVTSVRRAHVLVFKGKAEVLEKLDRPLTSATTAFAWPHVIRLVQYVRVPHGVQRKISRRAVFARDGWSCVYCGRQLRDLTLDHVMPRHRGGAHTWENLVSACKVCNHRKGGKTLQEARMQLMRDPFRPRAGLYYTIQRKLNQSLQEEWLKFIPGFEPLNSFGYTIDEVGH